MYNIYASLITIGDELLIGQTIDTNSAWLAQQLNALGILIKHRVAIADAQNDIIETLTYESTLSKLIIITGGLGPTNDDITKQTLAKYFNANLISNAQVLEHVTTFFKKRNRPMLDVNIAQANVLSNCKILFNEFGTAPGMLVMHNNIMYIALPGVPLEMKNIMEQHGLQAIKNNFKTANILHATLCTAGKGESFIAVMLKDFEKKLPNNIKLAYLPSLGTLKLRLSAVNTTQLELQNYFTQLQNIVKQYCFANSDTTLEQTIINILTQQNKTLSTAESCTGGAIANTLTNITGSSLAFTNSIVAYNNEAKISLLNINTNTIQNFGAVSEETVLEMAKNILQISNTNYAIACTGFLEKNNKEDAYIWIAVCTNTTTKTLKSILPYNRIKNKELAVNLALNLLRVLIMQS